MEGEDEDSEEPRAFNNRPAWQRALVLVAGSFMNLLTCVILLIIISFWIGAATNTLDTVEEGICSEKAGLLPGDTITMVDGEKIDDWDEIIQTIGYSDNDKAEITVDRNGKTVTTEVELKYDEETGRNLIGITSVRERHFLGAIGDGIRNTGKMTVLMVDILKQLFTGGVSVSELSGPVGIVYATNEAAKSGVIYVIYLAALLSLNLAIINMLPFPALDGGRLLFLVIRLFTGKRVSDATEGKIHFIGIMLLFTLMIYVTFNDVIRFIVPIF